MCWRSLEKRENAMDSLDLPQEVLTRRVHAAKLRLLHPPLIEQLRLRYFEMSQLCAEHTELCNFLGKKESNPRRWKRFRKKTRRVLWQIRLLEQEA